MTACHPLPSTSSPTPLPFDQDLLAVMPLAELPSALAELLSFCSRASSRALTFGDLEPLLCAAMSAITRRVLSTTLQSFDLDVPRVCSGDQTFRRVYRGPAPYLTTAGEVQVTRSLYRRCGAPDASSTVCPLAMNAGVIAGYWTPAAAKLATFALTHLTPTNAHDLFVRAGQMKPSRAALARVITPIHEVWEAERMTFEEALCDAETIPSATVVVAASLDGVMIPVDDGDRAARKAAALAQNKSGSGPIGYKEAGCATLSFYDAAGDRLKTLYYGRMPEHLKTTLKDWLYDEVKHLRSQRPNLRIIGIADGAKDNWSCLRDDLKCEVLTLDFYHATEHLKEACDAAFKDKTASLAAYEQWRLTLLKDPQGVQKLVAELQAWHTKKPENKVIEREWKYFEERQEQMGYAERKQRGEPIGSGVVEAACKTLVVERMRRSGMCWSAQGGQAIMTWRALVLSHQFDRAWALVSARFLRPLSCPDNVLPLSRYLPVSS